MKIRMLVLIVVTVLTGLTSCGNTAEQNSDVRNLSSDKYNFLSDNKDKGEILSNGLKSFITNDGRLR